jgi:hypothetical protein
LIFLNEYKNNLKNMNTVLNNSDLVLYLSDYLTDKEAFNLFSISKTLNNILNNHKNRYTIKQYVDENEITTLNKYKIKKVKNISNCSMIPYGTTHVIFEEHFFNKLDKIPDTVIHIIFGTYFNESLEGLPPNLKTLIFGNSVFLNCYKTSYFNKSVDELPDSLLYLELGHKFNQKINKLPAKLETLKLGYYYTENINYLPENLTSLDIRDGNLNINVKIPDTLQVIDIGLKYLRNNGTHEQIYKTLFKRLTNNKLLLKWSITTIEPNRKIQFKKLI